MKFGNIVHPLTLSLCLASLLHLFIHQRHTYISVLADPQTEVLELSIVDVLYAPQIPLRLSKIMFVIIQPLSTASVRIILISVAWKMRMAQLDPGTQMSSRLSALSPLPHICLWVDLFPTCHRYRSQGLKMAANDQLCGLFHSKPKS